MVMAVYTYVVSAHRNCCVTQQKHFQRKGKYAALTKQRLPHAIFNTVEWGYHARVILYCAFPIRWEALRLLLAHRKCFVDTVSDFIYYGDYGDHHSTS